ncbi:type II toxin-antitoxin system RelE/ParE family toxin [Avibacterium sp. 21-599]|uniref:type II toxin-antitoxin system RelE/ParE family toxin n=1 Tax=Avibacterium sp. 21-599 TaxID=2911528 RepID=UPI0022461E46|nr:type II toxin-antitoxin system RelE/ParE family toxin [Avibacterium sp. 21-599]MCW9718586.1 type II toxin-antitoxin system RelE/ParE family toxin [Avibacterium sp. 21-599]
MSAKKLEITLPAIRQVDGILTNVSDYTGSVKSAEKLNSELQKVFHRIAFFPKIGKKRGDETSELFCRHYRIVYREYEDRVEIITVIHSRRKYPLLSS